MMLMRVEEVKREEFDKHYKKHRNTKGKYYELYQRLEKMEFGKVLKVFHDKPQYLSRVIVNSIHRKKLNYTLRGTYTDKEALFLKVTRMEE